MEKTFGVALDKYPICDKSYSLRKKCPFCGGSAVVRGFEEFGPDEQNTSYCGEEVVCTSCDATIRTWKQDAFGDAPKRIEIREELIKKWNKRAT